MKDSQMLTNKQKILLMLAFMILSVSLVGSFSVFELARDSGSRFVINTSFIMVALGVSSGVLATALVVMRAFHFDPLLPEFPLWIKISTYYAAFMAVWGGAALFFSGENWQERVARQELEQVSNLTLIHAGMVVIGLVYLGALWFFPYQSEDDDYGTKP